MNTYSTSHPLSIAIFEMADPMNPVPPRTRIFGARAKAGSPIKRAVNPSSRRRIARQQHDKQYSIYVYVECRSFPPCDVCFLIFR